MAAKKPTFGNRANLNKVATLMDVAETAAAKSTPAARAKAAAGLPDPLAALFVNIQPSERDFLAKMLKQLDGAKLYDEYNPKLYYL